MLHQYLMADFETTLEVPTRVWLYAVADIKTGKVVNTGTSIEEFFAYLKNKWAVCFFHNLKFDGEFIVDYLLKSGFKHQEKKVYRTKQFSTLIDGTGQWYQVTAKLRKQKEIKFQDSLKLLPFPVRDIGKSFNLDVCKGDIDFEEAKRDGYKVTPERLDYVKRDVLVVAKALKLCYFDYGQTKMTIGANAMSIFKDDYCRKFDFNFPKLPDAVDAFCRKAYHGGYCYVNPKHQGEWVGKGQVFDVNSLYPYAMTLDLPYGEPVYFQGDIPESKTHPLYIVRFTCMFRLKEGYVPTIQIRKSLSFNPTEYLTEVNEYVELTLCSVDFEQFLEHYEVFDLDIIDGFMFRRAHCFFKDYIEHFMEEKMTTTGAQRQRAKLYLNNLYGKFATSPRNIQKYPYIDEEDGKVHYKTMILDHKDTIYIPVGVFVTANAKRYTINAIQANLDRFLYCDTDSIHILGWEKPKDIIVDDVKLGAWKCEGKFDRASFVKPKTYIEISGDHVNVKACGMPQNIKDDFEKHLIPVEEFKVGFMSDKKLLFKRVEGGVILEPTTFTIK